MARQCSQLMLLVCASARAAAAAQSPRSIIQSHEASLLSGSASTHSQSPATKPVTYHHSVRQASSRASLQKHAVVTTPEGDFKAFEEVTLSKVGPPPRPVAHQEQIVRRKASSKRTTSKHAGSFIHEPSVVAIDSAGNILLEGKPTQSLAQVQQPDSTLATAAFTTAGAPAVGPSLDTAAATGPGAQGASASVEPGASAPAIAGAGAPVSEISGINVAVAAAIASIAPDVPAAAAPVAMALGDGSGGGELIDADTLGKILFFTGLIAAAVVLILHWLLKQRAASRLDALALDIQKVEHVGSSLRSSLGTCQ